MRPVITVPLVLLLAGCGGAAAPVATAPTPSPTPSPTPAVTATAPVTPEPQAPDVPHFDTPEEAMRYLADAWNAMDLVKVKHVTTSSARTQLEVMRHEATDLVLDRCTYDPYAKDYSCRFRHGFPAGYKGHDAKATYKQTDTPGTATLTVGPADRSGWYATYIESCG